LAGAVKSPSRQWAVPKDQAENNFQFSKPTEALGERGRQAGLWMSFGHNY